jgi:hypothetical protein
VVARQAAGGLGGAGEVGVQPAAGGGDDRERPGQQPGPGELLASGEPVAGQAVVDVQDVGAGRAGGDGQVASGIMRHRARIWSGPVVASLNPCRVAGTLVPVWQGKTGQPRPAQASACATTRPGGTVAPATAGGTGFMAGTRAGPGGRRPSRCGGSGWSAAASGRVCHST